MSVQLSKSKSRILTSVTQPFPKSQNQKIRTLARKVDPDGQRSIGVLTKPDKVELGTERSIIDILTGQKYALRMGYFVVRTPNPTELDDLALCDPAKSFTEVSFCSHGKH